MTTPMKTQPLTPTRFLTLLLLTLPLRAYPACWIAYPGEHAIDQANRLMARRNNHGQNEPAPWAAYAPHPTVTFWKQTTLHQDTLCRYAAQGTACIKKPGHPGPEPNTGSSQRATAPSKCASPTPAESPHSSWRATRYRATKAGKQTPGRTTASPSKPFHPAPLLPIPQPKSAAPCPGTSSNTTKASRPDGASKSSPTPWPAGASSPKAANSTSTSAPAAAPSASEPAGSTPPQSSSTAVPATKPPGRPDANSAA